MTLKRSLILALVALSHLAWAESKLAILGLAEEKSLECQAVQAAVEAANSNTSVASTPLKAWFVGLSNNAELNLSLARKVAGDSDVLGVVLHGEAAASPEIVAILRQAGLATVSASSWAQPRAKEAFVTWLCPDSVDLAENAAIYARREAKNSQVAVLDNGAPTAAAAAKAFAARFRNAGGKVVFEGEWQGSDWGLTRTTRALKANWPQMLFFAGDAADAGRLVVAMKDEKELKATDLLGQPTVFEPGFFDTARVKSVRTRGFFPSPDFLGTAPLARFIGLSFPKTSPEYRAYVHVVFRKPGHWAAMLFDATALTARAVRNASGAPSPAPSSSGLTMSVPAGASAAAATTLTASALSPTAVVSEPVEAGGKPDREAVRLALLHIDGYHGIRGVVHFSASREPAEAKSMVYYALTRVNKKEMQWKEKNYGPPY